MSTTAVVDLNVYIAPKSMNAGGGGSRVHWAHAYRDKRIWEQAIMGEFQVQRVPRGAELVLADVVTHWKRREGADVTNYFASIIKPLADACQQWGLIEDDTDDFFRVGSFTFDYPETWLKAFPRLRGYVSIHLEVTYP